MPDYLMLMHDDAARPPPATAWADYLASLEASGRLQGGSAIGAGLCVRKAGAAPAVTGHLTGFIRVSAASLDEACTLVDRNPVFEAGGTVEVRELPRTG